MMPQIQTSSLGKLIDLYKAVRETELNVKKQRTFLEEEIRFRFNQWCQSNNISPKSRDAKPKFCEAMNIKDRSIELFQCLSADDHLIGDH